MWLGSFAADLSPVLFAPARVGLPRQDLTRGLDIPCLPPSFHQAALPRSLDVLCVQDFFFPLFTESCVAPSRAP